MFTPAAMINHDCSGTFLSFPQNWKSWKRTRLWSTWAACCTSKLSVLESWKCDSVLSQPLQCEVGSCLPPAFRFPSNRKGPDAEQPKRDNGPWHMDNFSENLEMLQSQQAQVLAPQMETGWDLGPGTLCCSACTWINVSSSNKIQRNYKELKITACSWGQLWTTRYKKTKNPTATSEEPGAKAGGQEKSRVLLMPPAHNTTKGVGRPPKPPLRPDPWTHPYPHPI